MKPVDVEIEDDDRFPGGGHARIVFQGLAGHAGSAIDLTFRRGGEENPWLGRSGWDASPARFPAMRVEADGDDLAVTVGQEVGGLIEELTNVEVAIPDLDVAGVAPWNVTPVHTPVSQPKARQPAEVPFAARANGEVRLGPGGPGAPRLPDVLATDQEVLGLSHAQLYRAHKGRLQVDPDSGKARMVSDAPWPARVKVTRRGDDRLDLVALEDATWSQTVSTDGTAFGLPASDLAAAVDRSEDGLEIGVDPKTGIADAQALEDDRGPPPPPPRVPFRASATGTIHLDSEAAAAGGLPDSVEPGGEVGGVAHRDLMIARRGILEVDRLTGRATLVEAAGWPSTIGFRRNGDGTLSLSDPAGGDYTETVPADRAVFGIDPQRLREAKAERTLIQVDPNEATGTLVDASASGSPRWWIVAAVGAVIALIVIALALWKGEDIACNINQEWCEAPAASTNGDTGETDEPASEDTDEPGPEDGDVPAEESSIDICRSPDATPADLHACALEAGEAGDVDRLRELLVANSGHGPTALEYARRIDSVDFEPGILPQPDDTEALRLLEIACRADVAGARDVLQAIGASLTAQVEQGDPVAQRILVGPFADAQEVCQ